MFLWFEAIRHFWTLTNKPPMHTYTILSFMKSIVEDSLSLLYKYIIGSFYADAVLVNGWMYINFWSYILCLQNK